MLTGWIRKLVLTAMLAAMPFQGIAAALSVVLCHGDAQAHALHDAQAPAHGEPSDHGSHGTDSSHEHGSPQPDDGGGAGTLVHLCCNLSASAPPPIAVAATLPVFSVRAFVPDSPHALFVPELPQRPPLV